MPLSPDDFARLQDMQTLCTQLEDDVRQLRRFGKFLADMDKRYRALSELYQSHWLALTESGELDDEQRAQIERMPAQGTYSILDQDTIWEALTDTHTGYVQLLKALARKI